MDEVTERALAAVDDPTLVHERPARRLEQVELTARRVARRLPEPAQAGLRRVAAKGRSLLATGDEGGPDSGLAGLRADAEERAWALAALESAIEEVERHGDLDPATAADLRGALALLDGAEAAHRDALDG